MNLHVVAFPDLALDDFERIQAFRKDHNSLYHVIGPHLTIMFSVPDMPLATFADEVRTLARGMKAIDFRIRCAVINKDSFSNNFDAFLIPDEGHSAIVKMHDRLYSGILAGYLRLDISYIPHISIANSPDPQHIKCIVDEWNHKDFMIAGAINSLVIVNYENRVITEMETIPLPR